jgi:hypothetical protein
MARRSTLSRLLIQLAMALYLLVGLLPAGNLVICVDGCASIALEVPGAGGSCGDCTDSTPCSGEDEQDEQEGCPCVDLAIARPVDSERIVRLAAPDFPAPPLEVTASVTPLVESTNVPPPRREAPRPARVLSEVRTVVLLV